MSESTIAPASPLAAKGKSSSADMTSADTVSLPSREARVQFNKLVTDAKQAEQQQQFQQALELYIQAGALVPNAQIDKKIAKLKKMGAPRVDLGDGFSRDEAVQSCYLEGGFVLPAGTYDRMFSHQREGVAWLWGLHKSGSGGILGDDMVCCTCVDPNCDSCHCRDLGKPCKLPHSLTGCLHRGRHPPC